MELKLVPMCPLPAAFMEDKIFIRQAFASTLGDALLAISEENLEDFQ